MRAVRDPAERSSLDARLGFYILVGTIPIGVFGLLFSEQIENGARSLTLIGCTLILLGLLLLLAEKLASHEREIDTFTARDGIIMGFAQAAALVPGVSRSGATLTAGLFLGFERRAAARYSFLLSVPAVVLSGAFELRHIGEGEHASFVPTAIATLCAFVVGYASIAFLLRWLGNHSTAVFVVYRVALGALVLALVAAGTIS